MNTDDFWKRCMDDVTVPDKLHVLLTRHQAAFKWFAGAFASKRDEVLLEWLLKVREAHRLTRHNGDGLVIEKRVGDSQVTCRTPNGELQRLLDEGPKLKIL